MEMNFKQTVLAVLVFVLVFIGIFVVTMPAFSEETMWPIWVVGFDFEKGEVIFEDEDGFLWSAPFGENSWAIGEEYVLILSEAGASIEE